MWRRRSPDVRRVVTELVRRAVAILAAHHAGITEDSPRLRYALDPGSTAPATRRWLRGEASREATQELLASMLEHVRRTFGAPPAPNWRPSPSWDDSLRASMAETHSIVETRPLSMIRGVVARDESRPVSVVATTTRRRCK